VLKEQDVIAMPALQAITPFSWWTRKAI